MILRRIYSFIKCKQSMSKLFWQSTLKFGCNFCKKKRRIQYTVRHQRWNVWQKHLMEKRSILVFFRVLLTPLRGFTQHKYFTNSGVFESIPGQVHFQSFLSTCICINWDKSAHPPRPRETWTFWFISLPGYIISSFLINYQKLSLQSSLLKIFCNTPDYFVFCNCLFKKLLLKDVCLLYM